jgi:SAM-dependent methyltransferase
MGPRDLGRVFNEVPELYDRVRPAYPEELGADLVAITGMDERSPVLEVGCGTGQATRSLAALGCPVTAIEPGAGMAELARQRLAAFGDVEVETSTFEDWDDRGRRFNVPWPPGRGTGSTRRLAGAGRMRCSVRGDGWRCSATSLSAGRVSRRCTPRPLISTSDFPPVILIGVIRRLRTRCG